MPNNKIDEAIYGYSLQINPFLRREDLEVTEWITYYKSFIKLKNGKKYIYDGFTNTYRMIDYDIRNMTREQWWHEFRINLREIMYSRDISQEDLAEKIGVSQKTISRYIRGDSKPDGYMIHKIARALNVSLDELNYRERS